MNNLKVLTGLSLRVFGAVVAFLLNVVVVRILGVEESADFFYLLTLSSAFSAIFTFGFYNLIQSRMYLFSSRLLNLFLQISILTFPINLFLMFCVGYLIGINYILVVFAALSCIPLSILTVYSGFLNKSGKYLQSVFFQNIATQLLFLIVMLSLKSFGIHIESNVVVFSYFICASVSVFPCVISFKYKKLKTFYLKYLFRASLPFFIVIFSAQIYMWGVNFTSMYSLSKQEYSALMIIQRVAFAIAIIVSVVDAAASPGFNRMYREGKAAELVLMMKRFTTLSVVMGFVLFGTLLLFDEKIISLFSDSLLVYKYELFLICLSQLLNCATGPTGSFLMMVGEQKVYKNIVLFISVMTLCSSLPAGINFGIWGISLVLFFSSLLQNGACVYYIRRKFGFVTFFPSSHVWKDMFKYK